MSLINSGGYYTNNIDSKILLENMNPDSLWNYEIDVKVRVKNKDVRCVTPCVV